MSTFETILVIALAALLVFVVGGLLAWWLIGRRGRTIAKRVGQLPMRQKAQLFNALGRGCASVGSERVLPLRSNTAQRAMRLRSRQQRNASPG